MSDDRLPARKPGHRGGACLPMVSPAAAAERELAAPEREAVGAALEPAARCSRTGDASPPAAGPGSAEHRHSVVEAARGGGSPGTPAASPARDPIRRVDVYTEGMRGGGDASVDGAARVESAAWCARCEQTGRTCNACVQRRHRAWRLVVRDGRPIAEVAALMRLPARIVGVLVAHERDRLELAEYRIDSIPTARVREFLESEMERDPSLTRAEVAHRMNMNQADFDRQLGYAGPRKANGAKQQRVGIPLASNLALALGRAPHELEGC